jgi:hypothetical protein
MSAQNQILSTLFASNAGGADNMRLDLTDNQKKKVEKQLL